MATKNENQDALYPSHTQEDAQLAAEAEAHFKATEVSYPVWEKNVIAKKYKPADGSRTEFGKGFAALAQIGVVPTPPSITVPPAIAQLDYNLAFDEEWKDLSNWNPRIWYEGAAPAGAIKLGPSSSGKVGQSLTLTSTRATNYQDVNVATAGGEDDPIQKTWLYGYFEASIKWTCVYDTWPAFWLFSYADSLSKTAPNGTLLTSELDILEGGGAEPTQFNNSLHKNTNGGGGIPDIEAPTDHWRNTPNGINLGDGKFHTYAALWTPTAVTWYLDDILSVSVPVWPNSTSQEMFMVLSMKAWHSDAATPDAITAECDWVRVWQPA